MAIVNMKNFIIILSVFVLTQCTKNQPEHIGTFETLPVKNLGVERPFSETTEELIKRLTWKLTITNDEMIIVMKNILKDYNEEPVIKMKYKVDGNYLLGEWISDDDSNTKRYIPFYCHDKNNIYGMGNVFVRIN